MVLTVAMLCVLTSVALTLYRALRGPSWGDRIAAIDFLNTNAAVLIVLVALKTGRPALLDAALVVAILGFLGTVALARYLLGGRVME